MWWGLSWGGASQGSASKESEVRTELRAEPGLLERPWEPKACRYCQAVGGASGSPEPDLPPLCLQQINQDLNIQLLKDGYRLDEIPDDEDLDLIPPKSVNPTCMCCQATSSTACHIQ